MSGDRTSLLSHRPTFGEWVKVATAVGFLVTSGSSLALWLHPPTLAAADSADLRKATVALELLQTDIVAAKKAELEVKANERCVLTEVRAHFDASESSAPPHMTRQEYRFSQVKKRLDEKACSAPAYERMPGM